MCVKKDQRNHHHIPDISWGVEIYSITAWVHENHTQSSIFGSISLQVFTDDDDNQTSISAVVPIDTTLWLFYLDYWMSSMQLYSYSIDCMAETAKYCMYHWSEPGQTINAPRGIMG